MPFLILSWIPDREASPSDPQLDAAVQFFLGLYTESLDYIDDLPSVMRMNLTSPWRFWFDCVTSIPWSCMDLHSYLVPAHRTPSDSDRR